MEKLQTTFLNEEKEFSEKIKQLRKRIYDHKPVVHHITNFVTMYQCARITAFLGAAPIMAFAQEETAQVTAKSDALVINTGTLNDEVIRSIPKSLEYANAHHIPVVLDPVGARLSSYRFDFIHGLLNSFHFDVIRCNGVELLGLHGQAIYGKGIDGASSSVEIPQAAADLARQYHCTVACTGPVDHISDGTRSVSLNRGCPQLPKLVGTGCMVNSLIASYLPVAQTSLDGAAAGILTMCLAGEAAAARLSRPDQLGTFETYLMDGISQLYTNE